MTAPPEIEVVTLADVRRDVAELSGAIGELSSLVRESNARSEERLRQLEERDTDKETRLRVLEKNTATRADVDALRAQHDARVEAARNRMPAWLSVLIAAVGVLVTIGTLVAGIAIAVSG